MSLGPIGWEDVRVSLDRNARSVAGLMRAAAPKADATVPGLEWSVSQLCAHLVTEARRFERFGKGGSVPLPDVAVFNADEIAQIGERDPVRLADRFLSDHATFMGSAAGHAGTDPFTWFGLDIEWQEAAAIYLGELSVHGLDLSRVAGQRWTIPRGDALNVAYGLLPILPQFVDAEGARSFRGSFELRLRGGAPMVLAFDDGALTVTPQDGRRADCVINADPEAFLLVGYGRTGRWGPILRGKILASGRKPWLGLKFNSLLVNP